MLLLILCQVLNAESKIQLLEWPLGTCLKGGIARNTKNWENLPFFSSRDCFQYTWTLKIFW